MFHPQKDAALFVKVSNISKFYSKTITPKEQAPFIDDV